MDVTRVPGQPGYDGLLQLLCFRQLDQPASLAQSAWDWQRTAETCHSLCASERLATNRSRKTFFSSLCRCGSQDCEGQGLPYPTVSNRGLTK